MARKLRVLLFGATGMVGQGVLRECLRDPDVEQVLAVGRSPTGRQHPRLDELLVSDMTRYSAAEEERLAGFNACFWCLGASAMGMSEADYTRVTFGLTIAAGQALARIEPRMAFVYVSGAGTDSTEKGKVMWARVKGRTENMLFRLPFRASFMFRPAAIRPRGGERSRTAIYRIGYFLARPFLGLVQLWKPELVTTTEEVGKAMLFVARKGSAKRILENKDIRAVARRAMERGSGEATTIR